MATEYKYVQTINGITSYANIPQNVSPETVMPDYQTFHYVHVVQFSSALGEDIYAGQIESNYKAQLQKQGNTSTITNFTAVKTSDNTLTIEYDATSPPLIIAVIAIGLALFALFVFLSINTVASTVSGLIKEGVNPTAILFSGDLLIGLGAIVAIIVGYVIYKHYS